MDTEPKSEAQEGAGSPVASGGASFSRRFEGAEADPLAREVLLVIGPRTNGINELERRFADWQVQYCGSYLAGIVELSRRPARAVLARVEGGPSRIGDAVAALREAGGAETKIVLSCSPAQEPVARAAMSFGADDYLLEPLDATELKAAVGYDRGDAGVIPAPAPPTATMEELAGLGRVLAGLDAPPKALLGELAGLIREALNARGAVVVASGATGQSGEAVPRPVLSAALHRGEQIVGQVLLGGARDGAYNFADARKLDRYAGIFSAVLAAASQRRELERAAFVDECSGLPNRRYLRERLGSILRRAAADRLPVTVLLFDVDNLKPYNDQFGHDAGDEIIRTVGRLFRKSCREQDVVVRYGGDEFCVVFWDPAGPRAAGSRHPAEALGVLDRFRGELSAHRLGFLEHGREAEGNLPPSTITISGGLAVYPWDGDTPEALLSRADQALLAAKRAGKNRVFVVGEPEAT